MHFNVLIFKTCVNYLFLNFGDSYVDKLEYITYYKLNILQYVNSIDGASFFI